MLKDYIVQNWALILVLAAFVSLLKTTVFLNKKVIGQMYVLISAVFVLSIVVFIEFYEEALGVHAVLRMILTAVRYSATPLIVAYIINMLIKTPKLAVFLPAAALTAVNIVSIFTGIVFSIGADGVFRRGPLGLMPYAAAGIYFAVLIVMLIRRSNRHLTDIIPIVFMIIAFVSGLILPFIFGKTYAQMFCMTIAISLFVYYVFSLLQLTKKDPLTGLLNRQTYYADVARDPENISALISLDMNGLKATNDTYGHAAGDKALLTLAHCFTKATKRRQIVYRVGGDEFVIVCRRLPRDEVLRLVERINKYVGETKYSCAVGYGYSEDGAKPIEELLRESDEMMYAEKARYYEQKAQREQMQAGE